MALSSRVSFLQEFLCTARRASPFVLVGFGDRWDCERGFERNRASCTAVIVPPHAHVDASGHAWECDSGYTTGSRYCVPSAVELASPPPGRWVRERPAIPQLLLEAPRAKSDETPR